MYTGTLIKGLLNTAERVRNAASVRQIQNMDPTLSGSEIEAESRRAGSEPEEFPKSLGLSAADRDLGLLLVVHPELKAGFKPRDHFLNSVNVH